jgi:excinuclease UvrABC nuclease subunit
MTWFSSSFNSRLAPSIPDRPGVYAYVQVERKFGLPMEIKHYYIGKTKNLRRRFVEHNLKKEQNPIFHQVKDKENLEFWWRTVPSQQIDQMEKQLISAFKPIGNRTGK